MPCVCLCRFPVDLGFAKIPCCHLFAAQSDARRADNETNQRGEIQTESRRRPTDARVDFNSRIIDRHGAGVVSRRHAH